MPHIEVTPELETLLAKAARERGCTTAELIASMLDSDPEAIRSSPLVAFTLSAAFRAKSSDADRYLALLGWIATNHPSDFGDFIEHQESGRRYLGMSPEEIRETCSNNQARPIPDTHFWAIMNLDTPTKRRFLRRLLVFVGETDAVVNHVNSTLGRGR